MSDTITSSEAEATAPAESTSTVVSRFRTRVATQPERPALRHHAGGAEWHPLDWKQYGDAVEEVAAGLVTLGIAPGDRVGLLSGNRPEWHIADMGILSVGGVTVPVYPTSSASQAAYVLADSGARVCFVDDAEQLAKVLLHFPDLPDLEVVVGLSPFPGLDRDDVLIDLNRLRSDGTARLESEPDVVERRANGIRPGDYATFVYTSGTTGPPKGTVLTHGNLEWTIDALESMVGLVPEDRFLSYLPLSHIAERMVSHFGQIISGGETWFAQSLATVPDDLKACRPTIFFAVPRVWQKFHDSILDQIAGMPKPARAVIDKYLSTGLAIVAETDGGPEVSSRDHHIHEALDRTIGGALRHKIGLDKARIVASSAAPIHPDLVRWFHALGLKIAEAWGQTEDCGPATSNPPDAIRIGTVGVPLPGLEIRTAEDGELLVRGGSVCAGYHNQPEATAELIDDDGWMSTGDLGSIDEDGYVTITGRKKDLIINAAGKNISPSEIESRLAMEPLIGQAVVVGDGRKYLVGLLTIDPDEAADWAHRNGAFADIAALVKNPAFKADVDAAVERVNHEHAPVEQLKQWRLLHESFTVEGGELTPTMKVKRSVVIDNNTDLVEAMYT